MAHFAQLDGSNQVTQVIVVNNTDTIDQQGQESEQVGITFCQSLFGQETRWLQTSYNGKIRKNFAGVGYTYDPTRDAFIPPKPYPSWVLDEALCIWSPPVPRPEDGQPCRWDEESLSWVLVQQ